MLAELKGYSSIKDSPFTWEELADKYGFVTPTAARSYHQRHKRFKKSQVGILKTLHESFNHVVFYAKDHKYYDRDAKKYLPSSTGVKKLFIEPFDANKWIPICAKKEDLTIEQLKKKWENLKLKGLQRGVFVHTFLESLFQQKFNKDLPTDLLTDKEIKKLETASRNFWFDHSHLIPIAQELVISNHVVAGQIDHLFYDPKTDEYMIYDIKTDKDIYKKPYGNLLFPLQEYSATLLNQYNIQLSIYADIFEEMTSIEISKIKIVWINDKNDNYEIIELDRMDLSEVWPIIIDKNL